MTVALRGRIDSQNSAQAEKDILAQLEEGNGGETVLDAAELEYISSAGLRVLLRIRKNWPDMRIINVSSQIYEILEMTGFTEMMPVEKAYRVVSVEGCEEIGRGANGTIYRIDQDNVVKVYNNADALADIQHEREVAKLALILGLPTAISYDVVRVGDSYGSVFELLNARSFSQILAEEPEKMDWCVREYVALLKKIHATVVPKGKLPDMKSWARSRADCLPEDIRGRVASLLDAVPDDDHMVHGDYHTKNVMLQNDEVMIIDMDTLGVGHPIFELAGMYNAFIGFSELDHTVVKSFQGFDFEISSAFWHKALEAYLGTRCPAKLREVENKTRILSYTRLISHTIRHGEQDTDKGRASIAYWTERLRELTAETDTLLFSPDELEIEAAAENLPEVQAFVEERLEAVRCPPKARMQVGVAVEEIFINIASYAYAPGRGKASVRVEIDRDPLTATITFADRGIPYDPLANADPDLSLPAEDRDVGGLGIFMTKKLVDDISYEYRGGQNILTLKKRL